MGWETSDRRSRLPSNWATLVRLVHIRDKGICYICKGPGADTVDHVVPGDNHSLDNLALVHDYVYPHCHRAKTAQESARVRAQKRLRLRAPVDPHPGLRDDQ